jgi:hypothetical protein
MPRDGERETTMSIPRCDPSLCPAGWPPQKSA